MTIHDLYTLELARHVAYYNFNNLGAPTVELFFVPPSHKFLDAPDFISLQSGPYSLRRGGAMYEFESHGLMQKVFLRGCWKNSRKNSNVAPLYICFCLTKMFWKGKQLLAFYSSVSIPEPRHFPAGKRIEHLQKK